MAEAVPVVDVMSGNSNSILEGLALANGGCGGFGGGNGALWILFLLVALGGGNFGGWGGRNALGTDLAATTAEAVAENKAGLNYIGQATAAALVANTTHLVTFDKFSGQYFLQA